MQWVNKLMCTFRIKEVTWDNGISDIRRRVTKATSLQQWCGWTEKTYPFKMMKSQKAQLCRFTTCKRTDKWKSGISEMTYIESALSSRCRFMTHYQFNQNIKNNSHIYSVRFKALFSIIRVIRAWRIIWILPQQRSPNKAIHQTLRSTYEEFLSLI